MVLLRGEIELFLGIIIKIVCVSVLSSLYFIIKKRLGIVEFVGFRGYVAGQICMI